MKNELRHRFRNILASMSREDVLAKSSRVAQSLFETDEFSRAETVMVFLSLATEVDTAPIVLRAWQDHKLVLAPRISWEQRRMMAIEIHSLTDDLGESRYGLREPVSGVPTPISLIDLVLVPGLGFDGFGNRLGRGRGFYDQFLSHADFKGVSCALAFEEQVVNSIPIGAHDRSVGMLITDREVRRFT